MDVYKEQLVKKATTQRDDFKKFFLTLMAISLSAFILVTTLTTIFAVIGIFLVLSIFYGLSFLIKGMSVEYEYLLTNGELDIDKISGQRTRKRLITFQISTAQNIGRLTDWTELNDDYTTVIASSGLDEGDYFIEFNHKDHGNCYLIFTPDAEMLELIKGYLPRNLRNTAI